MSHEVAIKSLTVHPRNAEMRSISEKAINGLIASIQHGTLHIDGWDPRLGYRLDTTITVNRQGSRVLGGHRRLEALARLGQNWLHAEDITWVDYIPDSPEELACVVKLNDAKIMGNWLDTSTAALRELELALPDLSMNLMLDEMIAELGSPTKSDYEGSDSQVVSTEQWIVLVELPSESDQVSLLERLSAEGYVCRALQS